MASGGRFWGHAASPQEVPGQPGHFETPKGGQFSTFMFTGGQLQPRTDDNQAKEAKETASPSTAVQGTSARHDPRNVYNQSPAGSRPPRKRGRPPKDTHSTFLTDTTTSPIAAPQAPVTLPGPPPPAGTHPFHRGPYKTSEDAFFNLQLHVFTSGYGVSQKRGVREKLSNGKYDPEGELIRKDFCCDKGGRQFKSVSTGQRKRVSTKTGCTWSATARRLKREGDLWFLEILQPEHNHPPTPQDKMTTIPAYRRWQKENGRGIRKAVSRLSRAAAMHPKQLQAYLRGDVVDAELDLLDKQIIRALSMGTDNADDEDAGDQACTVFDVITNRPTLILAEELPKTQASYDQRAIPRRKPQQESPPSQAPQPPQQPLQHQPPPLPAPQPTQSNQHHQPQPGPAHSQHQQPQQPMHQQLQQLSQSLQMQPNPQQVKQGLVQQQRDNGGEEDDEVDKMEEGDEEDEE